MALVELTRKINAIRYISKRDGAVDHDASDWDRYLEDPMKNSDALVIKDGQEPTIFILNFEWNGRDAKYVKDNQTSGFDDDRKPKMSMGSWAYAAAKVSLKGIENPADIRPYVEFKKEGSGKVMDSVLDKLERIGIIDEIWQLALAIRGQDEDMKNESKN